MARNDGIDRTTVRNENLSEGEIGNAQHHNEREKENYVNEDIVLERTPLNVHFKKPEAGYAETFQQMEKDGIISTRGLKNDAAHYGKGFLGEADPSSTVPNPTDSNRQRNRVHPCSAVRQA